MRNIQDLTCTPSQSEQLVKLGIEPEAYFWHERIRLGYGIKEIADKWETAQWRTPDPLRLLPAWTKEELDAMIGPERQKPDLYRPHLVTIHTNPNLYPVYFPNKLIEFNRGAQASAEALIYLLQKEVVIAADANTRYSGVFKT